MRIFSYNACPLEWVETRSRFICATGLELSLLLLVILINNVGNDIDVEHDVFPDYIKLY